MAASRLRSQLRPLSGGVFTQFWLTGVEMEHFSAGLQFSVL